MTDTTKDLATIQACYAAKERLRKKRDYLARVGLELQKGTALDPRSWI